MRETETSCRLGRAAPASRRRNPAVRFVLVSCSAAVVAALATVGCNGETDGGSGDGDNTNAGSSASDSGGSSNGGGSSGTNSTGGSSGESSGAGGEGTGGTDPTGGAAGESGGESSGGSSGAMGGVSGSGAGLGGSGAGGTGGMSGTGGSGGGAAGMTGTLGTPCSPRGALACAGNHQKLTILCGGDDTWQPNLTCGTDLFCDSTPGPNAGTCQPVVSGCENAPRLSRCSGDDKTLITCGPDTVTSTSMSCAQACHNGECVTNVSECPDWGLYETTTVCASDCGFPSGSLRCSNACRAETEIPDLPAVIRTPWADEIVCTCSMSVRRALTISLDPYAGPYVRVVVPPPWGLGGCDDTPTTCALLDLTLIGSNVFEISASLGAGPVNVVIEASDDENVLTCPP